MKTSDTKSSKDSRLRILIIYALDRARFHTLHSHYDVFYARGCDDGLLLARLHKPDLIISSCEQENNFKLELKKHLRTSRIAVLAIMSDAQMRDSGSTPCVPWDDFIMSPFEESELLLRVHMLLRNRSYLQNKYIDFRPEVQAWSTPEHFLQRIKHIIEQNLHKPLFGVAELAMEAGVSQPQLYRKLITLTGFSPNGYLRHIRLKHAAHLLSARAGNVSEIAYKVGFSSQSYFAKCFKAVHHQNPKRWSALL